MLKKEWRETIEIWQSCVRTEHLRGISLEWRKFSLGILVDRKLGVKDRTHGSKNSIIDEEAVRSCFLWSPSKKLSLWCFLVVGRAGHSLNWDRLSPSWNKYSEETEMFRMFLWTRRKKKWVVWCSIAQCAHISMFWVVKGFSSEWHLSPLKIKYSEETENSELKW